VDEADAVWLGLSLFTRLGKAYPGWTGFFTVVLAVLAVIGFVCAQIDPAKLTAQGYHRAATVVVWGRRIGGLAIALYKARKTSDAPPKDPPA
jgi:hypothetical protein